MRGNEPTIRKLAAAHLLAPVPVKKEVPAIRKAKGNAASHAKPPALPRLDYAPSDSLEIHLRAIAEVPLLTPEAELALGKLRRMANRRSPAAQP